MARDTKKTGTEVVPAQPAGSNLPVLPPRPTDTKTMSLPRIVVLQDSSNEVKRAEDKLDAGLFYNRLSKITMGTELLFIPLHHYPTRIRFVQGLGLQCRSRDTFTADILGGQTFDNKPTNDCAACKLHLWPRERMEAGEVLSQKDQVGGPECNIQDNFPALLIDDGPPDEYEFVIFQFAKTSKKAADDLKGLWIASRKPIYSRVYRNVIREAQGKQQVFYKQEVGFSNRNPQNLERPAIASPEQVASARKMIEFIQGKTLEFDVEPEEEISPTQGAPVSAEKVKAETAF